MNHSPLPPAAIAAARDAAKAHLRIESSDEDDWIDQLAAGALTMCEAFTGLAALVREWTAIVPADGRWRRLPMAPVVAISELIAVPEGSAPLDPARHALDIDAAQEGWVRIAPGGAARARVTYSAGIAGDWAGLPPPLAQGAVLLIAHRLLQRESGETPPAAVAALWRPWRRMRLTRGEAA